MILIIKLKLPADVARQEVQFYEANPDSNRTGKIEFDIEFDKSLSLQPFQGS
jgi:hypothetical protein